MVRAYPFTIRLKGRADGITQPVRIKIDPGSTTTGIAVVRENGQKQHVLALMELAHRGRTKFNRQRLGIPKTHALDAACVGEVEIVEGWDAPTLAIKATIQGISHRHCVLTQRADSYGYHIQPNQRKEEGDRENESR
jgi:hypothetical protein